MSEDGKDSDKRARTGNMDERVSTAQTPTASDLFRVSVKIPPFWPEKPHIWFSQIEGQFAMARITDDSTKFYHVLAHLDRQYAVEVEDIITAPPTSNRYDKLKSELIKRLSMSSEKKVKQLLQSEEMGDRNPSQFLRHLRHLAGPTIPNDFLRTVWSSRLPENLQTIVASQAHKLPLEELAELADRVHDVVVPSSLQVAAATACSSRYSQPTPGSTLDIMAKQIADLTKQIKRAAELMGYFIYPSTWWPLLEAEVDSWPALLVIANIVKGSQAELLKEKVLEELCRELADPDRCRTRKPKYQTELLHVCEALMDVCGDACTVVANNLFTINYTVYAMPFDKTIEFMALSNLDKLRYREKCGKTFTSLYEKHIGRVLADITSDALTWNLLTPDRCLLECAMLHSGSALGAQLHLIAPLLKESLAPSKVDPEVKLKIFTTLSTVLVQRQTNFRKCDTDKLEAFLNIVIEEVIMPNLVWTAGRTAEAIRTAAVACLCSALQDNPPIDDVLIAEQGGDGDTGDTEVNLFPTKESLTPFLDKMIPLLVGLVDDNSTLTRQHALRAICCLATLAARRGCFTAEVLHKLYFGVIKRLDDSSDKVRSYAVQTVCVLFSRRPEPYDTVLYGAHIDAVYSAMLIHLDDTDDGFRKQMLEALIKLSDVDPPLLMKKVKSNIHLYRNKAAYERLSSHLEKLLVTVAKVS